jgi:hypothetical protein
MALIVTQTNSPNFRFHIYKYAGGSPPNNFGGDLLEYDLLIDGSADYYGIDWLKLPNGKILVIVNAHSTNIFEFEISGEFLANTK